MEKQIENLLFDIDNWLSNSCYDCKKNYIRINNGLTRRDIKEINQEISILYSENNNLKITLCKQYYGFLSIGFCDIVKINFENKNLKEICFNLGYFSSLTRSRIFDLDINIKFYGNHYKIRTISNNNIFEYHSNKLKCFNVTEFYYLMDRMFDKKNVPYGLMKFFPELKILQEEFNRIKILLDKEEERMNDLIYIEI